jgi:hypothetical protein
MTDSNFKLLTGMGIRSLMHIIGRRHICTNTPSSLMGIAKHSECAVLVRVRIIF